MKSKILKLPVRDSFSVKGTVAELRKFSSEAQKIGYRRIKSVLYKGDIINTLYFPLHNKGNHSSFDFWGYKLELKERNEFQLPEQFNEVLKYAKTNFPLNKIK